VEAAIKAPTSKHQAPENIQAPTSKLAGGRRAGLGAWNLELLWCLVLGAWCLLLNGCATAPRSQIQRPTQAFPADALITQRGVLTVFGGKQFTLNGYLATSATNGQRLVLTENFGGVLADVLITPDGTAHVMKSSRAFKPQWIERYVATDVRCLFGNTPENDCPGETLGSNHFLIQRRWYKLNVQIVNIQPGIQPAALFDATSAEKP
jgi:hypothetical protein